jgi:hypothetical protein
VGSKFFFNKTFPLLQVSNNILFALGTKLKNMHELSLRRTLQRIVLQSALMQPEYFDDLIDKWSIETPL